jgi:sortase A
VAAPVISESPDHAAALPDYPEILNVDSNGMMGYLSIPKIAVSLPVYHGVEEAVLQVAVGHLQNTSLPIGGDSTHSVLSGHRGLPSASLFTDLDRVEAGDRFFLKSLDQTLAYEVDQILTVEPQEVSSLTITPGQDYVTLVTCTPYGINSHRLLIRGHRVPFVPQEAAIVPEGGSAPASWLLRLPTQYRHMLTGVAILSAILLLRLMVVSMSRRGEYPASEREKF